jgi:hypothetical protein
MTGLLFGILAAELRTTRKHLSTFVFKNWFLCAVKTDMFGVCYASNIYCALSHSMKQIWKLIWISSWALCSFNAQYNRMVGRLWVIAAWCTPILYSPHGMADLWLCIITPHLIQCNRIYDGSMHITLLSLWINLCVQDQFSLCYSNTGQQLQSVAWEGRFMVIPRVRVSIYSLPSCPTVPCPPWHLVYRSCLLVY